MIIKSLTHKRLFSVNNGISFLCLSLLLVTLSCSKEKHERITSDKVIPLSRIKNKAFNIGPELDSTKVEIIAGCDCCASDLLLINNDEFIFASYCLEEDEYFTGSYKLLNNKIELSFKPVVLTVENPVGDTLPTAKKIYKTRSEKTRNFEIHIAELNNKIAFNLEGEFGVEISNKERKNLISALKKDSIDYRLGIKL